MSKPSKPKGAWSPYVLASIAYCFSGYPALILMAINFGRYGYPKRRTFWLSVTPILFLLLYAMDWVSGTWIVQRNFAFRILAIWITYSQQIGLHRDWKALAKPRAPVWMAVLISLGVVAVMIAVDIVVLDLLP